MTETAACVIGTLALIGLVILAALRTNVCKACGEELVVWDSKHAYCDNLRCEEYQKRV